MATLTSPGVQVQVIDESFYNPAAPGTVPLIFVATAADKKNSGGTGTAQGTISANAGKVWTITSQRDLADTFGTPLFYTDAQGNPVHGGELNEYGLQAAYSLLGVSSRAYVVRADLDLSQLVAKSSVPTGSPTSGTWWVDTANTLFGVFEWNQTNNTFTNKSVASGDLLIINNDNSSNDANLTGDVLTPKTSFGSVGNYAIVVTGYNTNQLWYKNADNNWVLIGSNVENFTNSGFTRTSWQTSWPIAVSSALGTIPGTGVTFYINSILVTLGGDVTAQGIADSINSVMYEYGVGAKVVNNKLCIFADSTASSSGDRNTPDGAVIFADDTIGVSQLGFSTELVYRSVALAIGPHYDYPTFDTTGQKNASGSLWLKTTSPNQGANWSVKYFNGSTKAWTTVPADIYSNPLQAIYSMDKTGGKEISVGTIFVESNYDQGNGTLVWNGSTYTYNYKKLGEFKLHRRAIKGATKIATTPTVTQLVDGGEFTFFESGANSTTYTQYTVIIDPNSSLTSIASQINGVGSTNVVAYYDSDANEFSITHKLGGEIKFIDGVDTPLNALGFTAYNMITKTGTTNLYSAGEYDPDNCTLRASSWKPLVYEAKNTTPVTYPDDGQIWYSSISEDVDIMYNTGGAWVGYRTQFPDTDINGPQIAALAPTTQSDGLSTLQDGDIWISTAGGIDRYGLDIYVFSGPTQKWVKQDPTDQTTPNGWVFDDARWATSGDKEDPSTIKALLTSDYLDPDAPDPALYPRGTRLWNLRRSGFNVKKYVRNYIDTTANNERYNNQAMDNYFANRWVSASPNNADGSGAFGRYAQRSFVVAGFKELIDTNQTIRDRDTLTFNLIACPAYPEAIQNMVALNADRGYTAFVVGDTPFRLEPNGTTLSNWGNNVNGALDNGDVGGVSYDEYMGMFYPSGYTNDNTGNYIVVPPSHMILRTIVNSDAKSYQWFAPAGTRRGGVDNATSVGYITSEGEFKTVALHEGLRDVLTLAKINPIATFPGVGLVNYGNLTRAKNASSLDRINVARLVAYLRRQLDILARPFLFEPNDKITRNEIKAAAESLMLELVGQRALYDFIVVCDESNNTPARIDRNELWMDIAIEPVKAVEFIYIPLRLKKTGSIQAGL